MVLDSMIGVVDHFWIMREEGGSQKDAAEMEAPHPLLLHAPVSVGPPALAAQLCDSRSVLAERSPRRVAVRLFLAESSHRRASGTSSATSSARVSSARGVGGGTLDLISVSLLPPRRHGSTRGASGRFGRPRLPAAISDRGLDGLMLPALSAEQRSLAALADGDVRAALPSLAPAATEAYMPGDPDAASTLEVEIASTAKAGPLF